MTITLKKFASDPKRIIRKAPIIIAVNKTPTYAIIPYSVYKTKYEEPNRLAPLPPLKTKKPHGRLWRLLFT